MNLMADGVLKEMANIQKKEDEMIVKYQRERELRLRREEEKKAKVMAAAKKKMCDTLAQQAQDRKNKLADDKANLNE